MTEVAHLLDAVIPPSSSNHSSDARPGGPLASCAGSSDVSLDLAVLSGLSTGRHGPVQHRFSPDAILNCLVLAGSLRPQAELNVLSQAAIAFWTRGAHWQCDPSWCRASWHPPFAAIPCAAGLDAHLVPAVIVRLTPVYLLPFGRQRPTVGLQCIVRSRGQHCYPAKGICVSCVSCSLRHQLNFRKSHLSLPYTWIGTSIICQTVCEHGKHLFNGDSTGGCFSRCPSCGQGHNHIPMH